MSDEVISQRNMRRDAKFYPENLKERKADAVG